jgi:dihydroorotase/N-acyl-D-amino-acid deacylase
MPSRVACHLILAALVVLPVAAACRPAARPGAVVPTSLGPPYDLVVEGGRIVDGTGNAWFLGDVAIKGDRIARVAPAGLLRGARSRARLDARGLVVAPGFIDIQSHSRQALLTGDGRVVSKVTQGVTTEILGEGWTNAPVNDRILAAQDLSDPAASRLAEEFRGTHGFDAWLRAMERHGMSVNVGSFLGAATVRVYAKGLAAGAPTQAELDTMRAVMRRAMEDGAFGLASALIYPPNNFATTEELIAVARAMAPYGGVYITHMRSEADQLLEAIDEAIRIGRESGVPVEIYHLKAGGRRNWGKIPLAIAKIDSARAAGLDVQANMYPYVAGGTGLTACLPPWASADGKLFDNLRDTTTRERVKAEVLSDRTEWENLCSLATPEGVLVLELMKPENRRWVGKRLAEIAAEQRKPWLDAAIDLILSEGHRIGTIYFMMSEANVALQLRQPWIKIGTDAGGFDPDSARGLTHPRAYGTYPRILGRYVRDERVLSLEEAVRKMSSAVATRLGIRDRGLLREGCYADVVVFDPATIADRATFEQPHLLSVGVRHVLVNGVAVVRNGRHTGAKPGRIVRGPAYGGGGSPVSAAQGP